MEPPVTDDIDLVDGVDGVDDADDADGVDDVVDSDLGSDVDSEAGSPPPAEKSRLTEREEQILTFERQWWRHAGAKEQAIRDTFELSATRYYQLLNGLLDNPVALEREPMLVRRLRRLRAARARIRTGSTGLSRGA